MRSTVATSNILLQVVVSNMKIAGNEDFFGSCSVVFVKHSYVLVKNEKLKRIELESFPANLQPGSEMYSYRSLFC
jgi:hypothetical protein